VESESLSLSLARLLPLIDDLEKHLETALTDDKLNANSPVAHNARPVIGSVAGDHTASGNGQSLDASQRVDARGSLGSPFIGPKPIDMSHPEPVANGEPQRVGETNARAEIISRSDHLPRGETGAVSLVPRS
jgi:hypothetical protein